jgi:uncharacterized RDD family membrane protein YckC
MAPGGMVLAEWWQRAVAGLIDFILFVVAAAILQSVLRFFGVVSGIVVGLAYYGYLNGETGQTVGKMVMKIKVVSEETGETIGLGMGVVRALIYIVAWYACIVPGIVNSLFPLWDPKRQTIHDKAVKSLVVVAP